MTRATLDDIRTSHWREPVRAAYERPLLINTYLFRPVSFGLTWTAMRLGLSSEAVSWMSAVVGLAACAVLISRLEFAVPVGLALLCLFNLLDCVDGDLARTRRTQNPYGRFLDSVCGGIIDLAFWAVVGLMAYQHPEVVRWPEVFGMGPAMWAGVGFLVCWAYLSLELIEHSFDELLRGAWDERRRGEAALDEQRPATDGLPATLRMLQTNLRVRETHYVLLIVAAALQAVDVLLLFYGVYYTLQSLVLLYVYRQRGLEVAR